MPLVLLGIGGALILFTVLVFPYLKPAKFNPYLFYTLSLLMVISLFFAQEYLYALVLLVMSVLAGIAFMVLYRS